MVDVFTLDAALTNPNILKRPASVPGESRFSRTRRHQCTEALQYRAHLVVPVPFFSYI